MCMENDVDAPDGVDLDGDVDLERECDDKEEEDEEEEDEEEEEEEEDKDEEDEEEEEEKEEEDEDEDENDGKKPRTKPGRDGKYNWWWCRYHGRRSGNCAIWARPGDMRAYHMVTTSSVCPTGTDPGASRTTTNAGDQSPQWNGGFGAGDVAKTSPGGAKYVRSWGSRKDLGCGSGSAAVRRIGRWRQSPQRLSPWCRPPWGVPGWLCRRGVNQSAGCREGDVCCVRVRVPFLSCLFPLFKSIYLSHWSLHVSQGFWIAQGLFYSKYYGTSPMLHFCSSWRVINLLVMVLRLNKSLKLADSIVSFHTRLLRPSTSVSNGSKSPGQFRVRFRSGTEPLQRVLPHENPDRCHWAGFTTKKPALQVHNFRSN